MSRRLHVNGKCQICRSDCDGTHCTLCEMENRRRWAVKRARRPTQFQPGSGKKLAILEARYRLGLPLFHKEDDHVIPSNLYGGTDRESIALSMVLPQGSSFMNSG